MTSFGRRVCVYCARAYEARAENQRFCSQRCKDRPKPAAVKAKYARPSHRLGRKAWAYAVASGLVRCARGGACKWAEWVDGELVGGIIRGKWDLGHQDSRNRPEGRSIAPVIGVPRCVAALERSGCDDDRGDDGGAMGYRGGADVDRVTDQPMWPNDSGFSIVLSDAPDPDEVEPGDPRIGIIHLSCVIDGFPGIGRGLDLAREHGVADVSDGGEWIVGDLSRLAPLSK